MCAGIRGASVGQVPKTALAECRPPPNRPDNGTKLLLSGPRSFMIPRRWTMEFQLPSKAQIRAAPTFVRGDGSGVSVTRRTQPIDHRNMHRNRGSHLGSLGP